MLDISYKEYVDYYLNGWVAELGEEYRSYYYSKFNRYLSGGVYDVSDVLYDYSAYTFVLMQVEFTYRKFSNCRKFGYLCACKRII